jgi:hypothetical protein
MTQARPHFDSNEGNQNKRPRVWRGLSCFSVKRVVKVKRAKVSSKTDHGGPMPLPATNFLNCRSEGRISPEGKVRLPLGAA